MPDPTTMLLFAFASVALVITPGPDMLLIASRSISQGRAAGFLTLAGIMLGSYLHCLAAALGLSQLLLSVPAAYDVIRWAGCAYLLFLAWQTLRSQGMDFSPSATLQKRSALRIFTEGFLTNLLNPKVMLFMLALFPQFLHPEQGSVMTQMLVLATILNGIGLVLNGAIILFASHLRQRGSHLNLGRWPQVFLATVFGALALRIALASRN